MRHPSQDLSEDHLNQIEARLSAKVDTPKGMADWLRYSYSDMRLLLGEVRYLRHKMADLERYAETLKATANNLLGGGNTMIYGEWDDLPAHAKRMKMERDGYRKTVEILRNDMSYALQELGKTFCTDCGKSMAHCYCAMKCWWNRASARLEQSDDSRGPSSD